MECQGLCCVQRYTPCASVRVFVCVRDSKPEFTGKTQATEGRFINLKPHRRKSGRQFIDSAEGFLSLLNVASRGKSVPEQNEKLMSEIWFALDLLYVSFKWVRRMTDAFAECLFPSQFPIFISNIWFLRVAAQISWVKNVLYNIVDHWQGGRGQMLLQFFLSFFLTCIYFITDVW